MMKDKRIDQLENYILENGSVSIEQICDKFQISKNTVHRDLNYLTERNRVKKVYGGAAAIHKLPSSGERLMTFDERNSENAVGKEKIAVAGAGMICENDTVFLDSGTTVSRIIDGIPREFNNVTILTNSIPVLVKALAHPNLNVIAIPGKIKCRTASAVGFESCQFLKNYNISKAFMACTALSLSNGVTVGTYEECEIKKLVMERCASRILLADSTKFGKVSLITYASPGDFDYLITDQLPASEYLAFFEKNSVRVITEMA